MTLRRLRFAPVAVLGLAIGGALPATAGGIVELPKPVDLPAFSLADHGGKPFTPAELKGHWSLLAIGYTSCPDVCPFVLNNLADVVRQLSVRVRPDNLPKVIFVGVDPKRDQPILADYVHHFDAAFIGVTGGKAELDKLVKGLDGFYKLGRPDKDGFYIVQHTASVIVIGPDGRIHAKLSPPLDSGPIAEYLARAQIAYRRKVGG